MSNPREEGNCQFAAEPKQLSLVENITSNFTISFWFKSFRKDAGLTAIYDEKLYLGANDRHIFLKNGRPYVRMKGGDMWTSKDNMNIADSMWHHIALTCDTDQGQIL